MITDILVKGSNRTGKLAQARDMSIRILEELEKMLDYHHIKVPSNDPQRATSDVALCMPNWDKRRDGIVRILGNEQEARA
jgi:hypothetical protein